MNLNKESTINQNHLDPIFKWTGGKRREIKFFEPFFPTFVLNKNYNYIEPFAGGAAVYWHLNNLEGKNIINDFDKELVNFYKEFQEKKQTFIRKLTNIGNITEHDELEQTYYYLRNKDKHNGLAKLSDTQRAIRFFVVNQLAFSGMRRFNSDGEFNVPFGHYKKLNTDIIKSKEHRKLLSCTKICNSDFEIIMKDNDNKNTFCFLDPPYTRVFKKYSADNTFGEQDQIRLANTIRMVKNMSVMLIIDKSPFTIELYKDLIKSSYDLKYGVNIKNRFNTAVEHLIICNY